MTEKPKKPRAPRKTKSKSPTLPQEKVLDLSVIRDEYDKVTEYSTVVIDAKTNLVIKYKEVFDELEIQHLITEAYEHLALNSKLELGYFNNYAEFMAYINFLIIKYFSSIKEQMKDSTFEQNLLVMNELSRVKYFKMFFEEVFNPEEIVKVYQAINERAELADFINNLQGETKEQWDALVKDVALREKLNLQN